ncbi:MAG: hypothetical protein ACP6IS_12165 [Candidatus Asgardarchaeia archaeon]
MNVGRIIQGIFILAIGYVIIGGLTDGESAMTSFITSDLGFTVTQGLGLGYVLMFVGLILAMAGVISKKSVKI